jgi:hypothetical protein
MSPGPKARCASTLKMYVFQFRNLICFLTALFSPHANMLRCRTQKRVSSSCLLNLINMFFLNRDWTKNHYMYVVMFGASLVGDANFSCRRRLLIRLQKVANARRVFPYLPSHKRSRPHRFSYLDGRGAVWTQSSYMVVLLGSINEDLSQMDGTCK